MARVFIEAWSHGDGFLHVDTDEWINDRGELDPVLGDNLREYMAEHDRPYPHDDVIIDWIAERTGELPRGLHGDGPLWAHNLANFTDHLIDDIGFVVLSTERWGDLMITVSREAYYVTPEVYRSTVDNLEEWADYSEATGACRAGHRWATHDAVHLQDWDGEDPTQHRISELIRVPFDNRALGYVACPTCRKTVRFSSLAS